MQSPEDRPSLDPPGCLDSSSARSVLGKRQMRADVIVVVGITADRMPKMPLPKHDDVVKAFPAAPIQSGAPRSRFAMANGPLSGDRGCPAIELAA